MDTLAHSINGSLIAIIPSILFDIPKEISLPIIFIFAILGCFIDIYGEYKAKHDNYNWYNRAHNGDLSKILIWIPPIGLHILLDKLGHKENKRWYAGIWYEYFMPWRWKERMWLEFIQWLFILLVFFILFVL